jgi:cytochrome c oxidase subunit 2
MRDLILRNATIPFRTAAWCFGLACAMVSSGCSGLQSALDPAGREAQKLADIFWVMTFGAIVVWIAVIALALWSVRAQPKKHTLRRTRLIIVGGGAIVPTVVLTALLIYGLKPIPELLAPAPEGSLRIAVTGEQWWWRVRYQAPAGGEVVLANEIRLPVGQPVQFNLDSPDVIHSFWIPSLAGKVDMIPGRVTRLALTPTKTGSFRGACAEYCGTSHALMAFDVVVVERAEFDRWLADQSRPAVTPTESLATRGQRLFLANGCSGCHTIRGTSARGVIGPDLTHVGSRASLAAGTLTNEAQHFRHWVMNTDQVKPGVLMPSFHMLPAEDLRALAAYLEGLK